MKTDWHRYNLKRRVAQLPPIDEDTFNSKIASTKPSSDTEKNQKNLKKSKKLAQKKAKADKAQMQESVTESAFKEPTEEDLIKEKIQNRVDIPPTTCLFCSKSKNANFSSCEENIQHMACEHGLYLPEKTYLVDKEGLLSYLGEKIGFGNVCLVCSYQGKDVEAVREHMRSKRHMRIPYETEDDKLELSDFYDFRESYNVAGNKHECGEENDADWEDVSDDEQEQEQETEDDTFDLTGDPIINLGEELILPSGIIVKHRGVPKPHHLPERVLSEGQGTVIAAETRHFLKPKDTLLAKQQQNAWREKKRMDNLHDKRQQRHINFQPHFRDQLLQ